MTIKVFQIEVTSRARGGRQVFAVEAMTEPQAERRLEYDRRVPKDPVFNFQRLMSGPDIEAHSIVGGSVIQIA